MTPIQQMLLGVGAKDKTYVDDVFSTYLYNGTGSAQNITNGIDLAGEGGMVWTKSRHHSRHFALHDSARGATCLMRTSGQNASYCDNTQISSFNSNGFSVGTDGSSNTNGDTYTSWAFRKTSGFFTCLTFSGTGSSQTLNHDLGCIPGMIIVKRTDTSGHWITWQKNIAATSYIALNETWSTGGDNYFGTLPTSTQFTVSALSHVNASGGTYVAYLFGGGESNASEARSVYFDGSGGDRLQSANSSNYNFGSGNFTIEGWFILEQTGMRGLAANWSANSNLRRSWRLFTEDAANGELEFWTSTNGSSVTKTLSGGRLSEGQWTHFAVVRSSNTLSLYLNGDLVDSASFTGTFYNNTVDPLQIGGGDNPDANDYTWKGDISNFRIVKGTAVYTSAFKPPTEPLTSISGTSILCCNNSSITGSTTTSGTITQEGTGSPTASTDSPFDDPANFVFGEGGDQNLIKTGTFVGNGNADGPEINLGFEPQWIMIKDISDSSQWLMFDSMRGLVTGGTDAYISANDNAAESASTDWLDVTSTGFKITRNHAWINEDGDSYIYFCLRRPDGYVGKPIEDATKVFAMDTGSSSSTIPTYDSGFPVDFGLFRQPGTSESWYSCRRLTGATEMKLNNNDAEQSMSLGVFDSNTGWSTSKGSSYQSWMWKRHAGFDVVTYEGNGTAGHQIPHSLNKTPEMIWCKSRDTSGKHWYVYVKGLNGGTNPEQYSLRLNSSNEEGTDSLSWNQTAPTSTHFTLGSSSHININNDNHIAMLFSSVSGISKVSSYTGNGSTSGPTITTGFTPKFILIKSTTTAESWWVADTLRGLGTSSDKLVALDSAFAQNSQTQNITTSSTGFTIINNWAPINQNNVKFIYYAHA